MRKKLLIGCHYEIKNGGFFSQTLKYQVFVNRNWMLVINSQPWVLERKSVVSEQFFSSLDFEL